MVEPKTWFIADQHYGHKRIIELANRPFASVEEMDESMIANHNRHVAKNDTVWMLGDFAFADHMPYLSRLNGNKHLVRGNHDHSNRVKKAVGQPGGWLSVSDVAYLTLPCGTPIVMCHYGMRVWRNSHHGSVHLYGHSHGNLPGDSQSCDVGVDAWKSKHFRPIDIELIKERLANSHKRTEPDHHTQPSSSAA